MGAIAKAPDGTLWAGTGEANPPGGGLTYFGDGIYKSTDNGATWSNMGLPDSAAFGRIAVDPTNSNRVFAAAAGHIARSVADRGVYRTEDAGKTWERVITPTTPTTGGIDLEIHPTNPNIVYAALWDHRRTNGTRIYGGSGSGLFRSKDGGDTWERLQNIVDPLPAYDQTQTGLKSTRASGASASPSRRATRTASTSSPAARPARTRASTSPTTAATRCASAAARTRPTASSGGSARSGSTRRTRTTSSTPT